MDSPAAQLLDTAERVTPEWARSLIERVGKSGIEDSRAQKTVQAVTEQVQLALRQLLATDPESQRSNPLTVFRQATAPITALLTDLGIPPVQRDEFEQRSFPDDIYGLSPATWVDIHPDLVEPGLEWGAWKAAVIISRHRQSETRDPSPGDHT